MKKNMIWNAVGNLTYQFCQWVITVLVTVLDTGFADAGLLSIAMAVSATFQTVAMFGIRSFQVSDVEEKYSHTCYVSFRIVTCAAAALLCMAFSLISGYFGRQFFAIALFMLFRLAENFSDVLHGIAQKKDRLDIAGKSFAIKGIGLVLIFGVAYATTHQLLVGIGAIAVFSVASTLLYDLPATVRLATFGFYEPPKHWLALAKETFPLCIYLFLTATITSAPKLILEKLCGEEVLGAYSSIFAPALLICAAAGYLYNPFIPAFAERWHKGDTHGFLSVFAKLTAAIAAVSVLVLGAGALLGRPVLILVFGEKISAHTAMLLPVLAAISVFSFTSFLCVLEIVLRDFLFLIIGCTVGVGAELGLTQLLIRMNQENGGSGADGASYAVIAGSAIAALILLLRMLFILRKRAGKGEA